MAKWYPRVCSEILTVEKNLSKTDCCAFDYEGTGVQPTFYSPSVKVIKKCSRHAGFLDPLKVVVEETLLREEVRKRIESITATSFTRAFSLDFNTSHVLEIRKIGAITLTNPQKAAVQTYCDSTFGSGKVVVI